MQIYQALLPSLRLDLLPKSAIDLFVTVLECDGPLDDISSGITAASVALSDAGIQAYGLVIGTCASIVAIDDKQAILFDPTYKEARSAQGSLALACMPAMSSSTNLIFEGIASRDLLKQTVKELQATCAQIHGVAVQALLQSKQQAQHQRS